MTEFQWLLLVLIFLTGIGIERRLRDIRNELRRIPEMLNRTK
jgi:hypothetical protein